MKVFATAVSNPGESPETKFKASVLKLSLLAVMIYALFVGLRVWIHGRDPSFCICASRTFCDPALTPVPIKIRPDSQAYDGLFFYRLALSPGNTAPQAFGIHFDTAPYRQQRVGYPFVCWVASLGRPAALATVMILVNLCWLGVLAAVCVRWVGELRLPPAWGLLPLLWPGFLISLGHDLSEIQEAALLATGAWLMFKNRLPWAALFLAGAALTREQAVFPIAGLGLYCAIQALRRRQAADGLKLFWFLVPAGIVLAWHLYLRQIYHVWPAVSLITPQPCWEPIPFKGIITFMWQGFPFGGLTLSKGIGGLSLRTTQTIYVVHRIFQLMLCLFVTLLAALALRSSRSPGVIKIVWIFTGLLLFGLTGYVWSMGPSSFLRIAADSSTFGLLIIVAQGRTLRWLALAALAAAWLSGFVCYLIQ